MFTDVLIQRVDFIIFFQGLCLFFCAGFSVNLFRRTRSLHWLWMGLMSGSLSLSLVLLLFGGAFPDIGGIHGIGLSFHLLGLFFIALFGAQCLPPGRARGMGYVLSGTLLILPACMTAVAGEAGFVLAARGGLGVAGSALGAGGALMLSRRAGKTFSASFYRFMALYVLSVGMVPGLANLFRAAGGHPPSTLDFEPGVLFLIISTALAGAWAVVFARSEAFGSDGAEGTDHKKVLAFAFGVTAVGVAVTLGFTLTELMGDRTEQTVRKDLFMLVSAVGNALDQEDVAAVSRPPFSGERGAYKRMLRQLTRIRLTNKELRFIYLVGMDRATRDVVILLDTEPPTSDDYAPPGEVYAEAPESLRRVFSSGRTELVGPYTDRWGNWVSGFAPVKDEYGAILGVVGMDLDAAMLRTAVASSRLTGIVITFLLAVIGAGVGLLIERNYELVGANRRLRREVTWRVQAENDLREAQAAAERANRAKGDFLARMSHEIRTPMNSIIGMADLAMDAPESETRGHVRVIADSARHLLAIINDVLDVSKIEAGKMDLESVVFDVADLFESVRSIMDVQARNKGLKLSFRIDPAVPEYLRGDPGRIRQILINLAGNGIKFTDRGGVTVSAFPADRELCAALPSVPSGDNVVLAITVKDTGIGIPDHRRDEIFKGFVQGDGAVTRLHGGTGLGLSISRQLAELMGGTIRVERSEEGGSLFVVLLVLDQADTPPSETLCRIAEASERPAPVSMSILTVEDNEPNAVVVEAHLKKMGHTMTLAKSGDAALELPAGSRFDLVLMDIQLPGRDGIETTRAIRSGLSNLPNDIPIIMISAHAVAEVRDRGLAAGADDFVVKPIDFNELGQALRRASMRKLAGGMRIVSMKAPVRPMGTEDAVLKRSEGNAIDSDEEFLFRVREDVRDTMARMRRALDASSLPDLARHAHHLANSLLLMEDETALETVRELEEAASGSDYRRAVRAWGELKKDLAWVSEQARN